MRRWSATRWCTYLSLFSFFLFVSADTSRYARQNGSSTGSSNISIPSYSVKSSNESLATPRSEAEILSCANVKPFSFNELKNATRNFRPDSLLGEGGFGYVFKGWIDEHTLTATKPGSGLVIAVKKLKPEGFQGHKEWLVCFYSLLLFWYYWILSCIVTCSNTCTYFADGS